MRALFVSLAFAFAIDADAGSVQLTLAREVRAAATLSLARIDTTGDMQQKAAESRRNIDLGSLPSLDLAAGHWSIGIEGEGVWHARQYFTVAGDTSVVLDVWPAATVTGTIAVPKPPAEITLRFQPSENAAPATVTCPVTERRFRCSVPSGVHDLRVGARGHIARYLSDLELETGRLRDLGAIQLREGQSISGWIELPRGMRGELRNVVVRAETIDDDDSKPLNAQVAENGFFHLDGVTPGTWTVRARHPKNLYAHAVSVPVIAGADAQLVRPLVLERPHRVEVSVTPARDPDGRRWSVEVMREIAPSRVGRVAQSEASESGIWTSPSLLPGRYTLSVSSGAGDEWHRDAVLLGAGDLMLPIVLEARRLRGSITIGGEPLQASLVFATDGRYSSTSSNADGEFSLTVPKASKQAWDISIESELPPVNRTLKNVEANESGEISIDLPNVVVRGEVVDEEGKPVGFALVRVLRTYGGGKTVHVPATEIGTFSITGLDPGENELLAVGDNRCESEPLKITIPEKGEMEAVRLVVHSLKKLRGFIVSDFGAVAGAEVWVFPTDVPSRLTARNETDSGGRFVAYLPPQANEFDIIINAPGLPFTMDHGPYHHTPARVRMAAAGGTLVVRGTDARIVHNRAILWAELVALESGGTTSAREHVMPRMEPGPYSACLVDPKSWDVFRRSNGAAGGRCVSGVLAPNGTLTLELEERQIAAR